MKKHIAKWIKNTNWLLNLFHGHFHDLHKRDKDDRAYHKTDAEWQNEFDQYLLEHKPPYDVDGKKGNRGR